MNWPVLFWLIVQALFVLSEWRGEVNFVTGKTLVKACLPF